MPVTVLNPNRDSVRTFQLPVDQTLEDTQTEVEAAAAAAAATTAKSTKSTRPSRSQSAAPRDEVDLSLTGIRPSDATRALLEHQLRSSTDAPTMLQQRKALLEHLGQQSSSIIRIPAWQS